MQCSIKNHPNMSCEVIPKNYANQVLEGEGDIPLYFEVEKEEQRNYQNINKNELYEDPDAFSNLPAVNEYQAHDTDNYNQVHESVVQSPCYEAINGNIKINTNNDHGNSNNKQHLKTDDLKKVLPNTNARRVDTGNNNYDCIDTGRNQYQQTGEKDKHPMPEYAKPHKS